MRGDETLDSAVAQKDRISIDVSDLREEIEICRNDAAWTELPLSAKIRVLVKERLEEIKAEQPPASRTVEGKGRAKRGEE
jgi:hypothetical protein